MSFADLASSLLAHKQQIDYALVNDKAEEITNAYLKKLEHPDLQLLGNLLPDGKSFSCIAYCNGMTDAQKRAVAKRLAEAPYSFKVDANFNYHTGDRIVIAP